MPRLWFYISSILSDISDINFQSQSICITSLQIVTLSRIRTYIHEIYLKGTHTTSTILHILYTSLHAHITDTLIQYELFLKSQESPIITYNYRPTHLTNRLAGLRHNYPDDTDATASALFAVYQSQQTPMSPKRLARFLFHLHEFKYNRNHTGYTNFNLWYSHEKSWQHSDPVAHTSIWALCAAHDIDCTSISRLVIDNFKGRLCGTSSTLYPFIHTNVYLFSRIVDKRNTGYIDKIYTDLDLHQSNLCRKIDRVESHMLQASYNWYVYMYDKGHVQRSNTMTMPNYTKISDTEEEYTPLYTECNEDKYTTYAHSKIYEQLIRAESALSDIYLKTTACFKSQTITKPYLHLSKDTISKQITSWLLKHAPRTTRNDLMDVFKNIYNSPDYNILVNIFRDSQKQTIQKFILSVRFMIIYYLYDKLCDKEIPNTFLPLVIMLYRQTSISLLKLFPPLDLEKHLLPCDLFYLSHKTTRRPCDNFSIPYNFHVYKSLGICLVLDIFVKNRLDSDTYNMYTQGLMHIQLARQLADDLTDYRDDVIKGKYTTASLFLDKENRISVKDMLDKIKVQCAIVQGILLNIKFRHIQPPLFYTHQILQKILANILRCIELNHTEQSILHEMQKMYLTKL